MKNRDKKKTEACTCVSVRVSVFVLMILTVSCVLKWQCFSFLCTANGQMILTLSHTHPPIPTHTLFSVFWSTNCFSMQIFCIFIERPKFRFCMFLYLWLMVTSCGLGVCMCVCIMLDCFLSSVNTKWWWWWSVGAPSSDFITWTYALRLTPTVPALVHCVSVRPVGFNSWSHFASVTSEGSSFDLMRFSVSSQNIVLVPRGKEDKDQMK